MSDGAASGTLAARPVQENRPRVIILGAGFGGLFAARTLAHQPVEVLLIDRSNFHTFTPLLYQVATCALDPSEIAYPIRTIFRKAENIRALLGEVVDIDPAARTVSIQSPDGTQNDRDPASPVRVEPYDYLILATGSTPAYFGRDDFRAHAWELRTLEDAIDLRNHILTQFEQAVWSQSSQEVEARTTIVVVGGGPTGLETAGAIYELYNHVLAREFTERRLHARVFLVEMQPHLLAPYPAVLREAARAQLASLGVEVILGNGVAEVQPGAVVLGDGRRIATHTLVWAAGVRSSPVVDLLPGSESRPGLKAGQRLPVDPYLQAVGLPGIYAVGDLVYLEDENSQPYPMLIPVAQQQGILAARNILAELRGKAPQPFRYHDRGTMATIGRSRAVAWLFNRIPLSGYIAWLAWLFLHLMTLLGFRNRVSVFLKWVWNYFTFERSVRIILRR